MKIVVKQSDIKLHNPMAKALIDKRFRNQVIKNKKAYCRKVKFDV